jgi:hypothetical protein
MDFDFDKLQRYHGFVLVLGSDAQQWILPESRVVTMALRETFGKQAIYDGDTGAVSFEGAYTQCEKLERWAHRNTGHADHLRGLFQLFRRTDLLRDPKVMARIQETGTASFEELEIALPLGAPVWVNAEVPYAGILRALDEKQTMTGQRFYDCTIEVVSFDRAGAPAIYLVRGQISYYSNQKPVATLEVRPLTSDGLRAQFSSRGALAARYAQGTNFVGYQGVLEAPDWFGKRRYRADGRVMIDNASLHYFDPQLDGRLRAGLTQPDALQNYIFGDDDDDDAGLTPKAVPGLAEADYWRTWPRVPAFSLSVKRWGLIDLTGLSPITFREDAFDLLVLDPEIKQVVHALVKHSGQSFTDLIDGKSGGCIFLLHGEPGVGKTLTAEAVAEVLNRPLYSVSVGELGTDPQELEASLRKILDMASRWNAVLLLDEADIFLEARNEHDIHRNAMVGVFLRLLEYHTGVLFLTTNRVRNFDPAFHSRISLALQYPNLTSDTRAQVIANLSQKARVPIDVDRFKDEPINGRQIKNALRIAQTLAQAENTPFTNDHLARVLELTGQFQRYLEEQQMPTTP